MLQKFSWTGMAEVKNPEVLEWATTYEPVRFPWGVYLSGLALIIGFVAWYANLSEKRK
jgi:hypothetical protein